MEKRELSMGCFSEPQFHMQYLCHCYSTGQTMPRLNKNSSDPGTDEILLLLSFFASISVSLEDERSKTSVLA